MTFINRKCDYCSATYKADSRNLKRGWGLCCSKSCAANKREKSNPNYDPKRVIINNERRKNWNVFDENGYGVFKGRYTSEGYRIYGDAATNLYTAIDEYGEAVYSLNDYDDDTGDSDYWDSKDY